MSEDLHWSNFLEEYNLHFGVDKIVLWLDGNLAWVHGQNQLDLPRKKKRKRKRWLIDTFQFGDGDIFAFPMITDAGRYDLYIVVAALDSKLLLKKPPEHFLYVT